jgi:hypothetical protein
MGRGVRKNEFLPSASLSFFSFLFWGEASQKVFSLIKTKKFNFPPLGGLK